jgi:hypothetical protein
MLGCAPAHCIHVAVLHFQYEKQLHGKFTQGALEATVDQRFASVLAYDRRVGEVIDATANTCLGWLVGAGG